MAYETEYSNFPTQNITLHNFKNINDNSVTYTLNGSSYTTTIDKLIAKINTLRASTLTGDRETCVALMRATKDVISPYFVDAETFNTWEQEIYNTQVYAKSVLQSVHFGTEEPECMEQDVWIGDPGATGYD